MPPEAHAEGDGAGLRGISNRHVAELVWRAKYAAPGELSLQDTWVRTARAAASVEADPQSWERRFLELFQGFSFLPGGRILAGAGVPGAATLCNCFVLGRIENSDSGVRSALSATARTLLAGGGVGADFSTLSPAGTVRDAGPPAPGPVACLGLWQAMAETLLLDAPRRGAMMATLRCDHPDIEAFISAKQASGALPFFNLSVQVTDRFLEAVEADKAWPLVFGGRVARTLRARRLFEALAHAAYETGEPGFLFIDQIRREDNLWWRERITTTNPCGEIPLPPDGACDLGSVNLTRFIARPFTRQASVDFAGLTRTVTTAVRFLDNILDITAYPLASQAEEARAVRRIGLGVTGLADALLMLGLTYGEPGSLAIAGQLMSVIRNAAYAASIDLAREKGVFPAFAGDLYLQGAFIRRLPPGLQEGIRTHGIRNSHLLAIAPTGSISLLAGGVSTGLEPIYSAVQRRTIHDEKGVLRDVELTDPAVLLWRALKAEPAGLPPGFTTAAALEPSAHADMQAALQPFVDQGISKTWNLAPACAFDTFRRALDLACRRGLKGFAVFRPGGARQPLLSPAAPGPCAGDPAACG